MVLVVSVMFAACSGAPARPSPEEVSPSPPSDAAVAAPAAPDAGVQVDTAAFEACKAEGEAVFAAADVDWPAAVAVGRCFLDANAISAAIVTWRQVSQRGPSEPQREATLGLIEAYQRANRIEPGRFDHDLAEVLERYGKKWGGQPDAAEHLEHAMCLRLELGDRDAAEKLARYLERLGHQPGDDLDAACQGKR